MRVLLVEDNRPTARAMRQLLELEGIDVDSAANLSEGLSQLANTHADWVLVDLMLPDGDGEVLVQRIRDEHKSVRVAVLTGVIDPDRLAHVRDLGPDLVMSKPFDPDALLQMIQ